jgi:hypothetical protein
MLKNFKQNNNFLLANETKMDYTFIKRGLF